MQVILDKESTHMLFADRVLPDPISAARTSGNLIDERAAATFAAWDGASDASTKGAVLFEAWWVNVINDPTLPKDDTINF
jgi:acyl-homoserine-lactone acylase